MLLGLCEEAASLLPLQAVSMRAPTAKAAADTAILVRVACAVLVEFMVFFLRSFWEAGLGQLCGGRAGGIGGIVGI
ncbi:hypothetical protein GCM10009540_85950 [Streptomyces turgidiscabies]